jgi:hypothetical protein
MRCARCLRWEFRSSNNDIFDLTLTSIPYRLFYSLKKRYCIVTSRHMMWRNFPINFSVLVKKIPNMIIVLVLPFLSTLHALPTSQNPTFQSFEQTDFSLDWSSDENNILQHFLQFDDDDVKLLAFQASTLEDSLLMPPPRKVSVDIIERDADRLLNSMFDFIVEPIPYISSSSVNDVAVVDETKSVKTRLVTNGPNPSFHDDLAVASAVSKLNSQTGRRKNLKVLNTEPINFE